MPVTVDYASPEHIIHYVISDPWTIDQFVATFHDAKAFLDQANFPVHWVVNLGGTIKDPSGVLRPREHPAFTHPHTGYVVFCMTNALARRIVETMLRLARFKRTGFFQTEEQAYQFVRDQIAKEKR